MLLLAGCCPAIPVGGVSASCESEEAAIWPQQAKIYSNAVRAACDTWCDCSRFLLKGASLLPPAGLLLRLCHGACLHSSVHNATACLENLQQKLCPPRAACMWRPCWTAWRARAKGTQTQCAKPAQLMLTAAAATAADCPPCCGGMDPWAASFCLAGCSLIASPSVATASSLGGCTSLPHLPRGRQRVPMCDIANPTNCSAIALCLC